MSDETPIRTAGLLFTTDGTRETLVLDGDIRHQLVKKALKEENLYSNKLLIYGKNKSVTVEIIDDGDNSGISDGQSSGLAEHEEDQNSTSAEASAKNAAYWKIFLFFGHLDPTEKNPRICRKLERLAEKEFSEKSDETTVTSDGTVPDDWDIVSNPANDANSSKPVLNDDNDMGDSEWYILNAPDASKVKVLSDFSTGTIDEINECIANIQSKVSSADSWSFENNNKRYKIVSMNALKDLLEFYNNSWLVVEPTASVE